MRERGALDRREMITRAPLIIPPNGAIFLPAAQPSGVGTEKGGRRERSFVWLESGIAQIQFHRRERDPVRSSARSSFHKHIYRRLDALQWRFNLANAFCALWPAGLSLSLSLSLFLSVTYPPLRSPLIRSFLLFLCLFDGSRLMERTFSIESNQVSSKSIRFKSKNRFFFFLEMNRCSTELFPVYLFFFFFVFA